MRIFLLGVFAEFDAVRDELAVDLRAIGHVVVNQKILRQSIPRLQLTFTIPMLLLGEIAFSRQ